MNNSVLTSNPKAFKANCIIYPQFPQVNKIAAQTLFISETVIFLMHSSSKTSVSFLQALHLSQSTPLSTRIDITLSFVSLSIILYIPRPWPGTMCLIEEFTSLIAERDHEASILFINITFFRKTKGRALPRQKVPDHLCSFGARVIVTNIMNAITNFSHLKFSQTYQTPISQYTTLILRQSKNIQNS